MRVQLAAKVARVKIRPQPPSWELRESSVGRSELSKQTKPDENVWHPFVDVASMVIGLYLLPEQLGGDCTLTHEVDEINVVVQGRSRLNMGQDTIDVAPGSIVFVERGVGHYFTELDQDFEVLILSVKKTD